MRPGLALSGHAVNPSLEAREPPCWRQAILLGLQVRGLPSLLMVRNFPRLAARNDRDMKWKKFLYKLLCETEGIYTCCAPSCAVCVDYHVCFGPED